MKISDEEIVEIIEKRIPVILNFRPDLRVKIGNLIGLDLVRRDEIIAILEELKNLRKETNRMFEDINKRFEEMNERFDRRFAEMNERFNKRFEEMNERFEEMNERSDRRFAEMNERFNKRFEEMNKRFEEMDKRFEEMNERSDRRFAEMNERFNKRFEEMNEQLRGMREDFHNAISGVGSRWGIDAERAFRAGMRKILKENFGADVEEYYIEDKEGIIKGRSVRYQVDLLVKDSVHIIVDVKSSADDFDVYKLHKLGEIYHSMTGMRPRIILVSAYVREEAMDESLKWGDVEIITGPRQFRK